MKMYFWKSILPLFCILLLDAMSFGIVIPVLGPMLLEPSSTFLPQETSLHYRTLIYSLSLGLPMAFMFVGAPLLGDVSDQIGRKKALLIALLGILASCLISAVGVVIGSVFLLLAGRSILGFMDSSESVAKAAMADISCSAKQKVINMSLATFAGTAGFVMGPMIGGWVSHELMHTAFGYTTPFLLAAVLAVLNAVLLFFLFHETYVPQEKKKFHLLGSFQNLAIAFVDQRIRLLAIIFFCIQFSWGSYFQSISILLVKALNYQPEQIGLFLSFLGGCFMIAVTVAIRIALEFLSEKGIILLSLVLIFVSGFLISVFHREAIVWISLVPMCLGIGMSYNTMLSLFSEAVDKDNQGRVMGVSVALFSSAWVASSIVGGMLSAVNLYLPYALTCLVTMIGFGIALVGIQKKA
jgi:DHA1 family tetracycline resistance protein-like MFS transporter